MRPFGQRAAVELRPGQLVVLSMSRATSGLGLLNGWHRTLDPWVSDDELGAAVLEARNWSVDGVARDSAPDVVKMLGFRSFRAYMRDARSVSLEWTVDGTGVEIWPSRNTGREFAFLGPETWIQSSDLSPGGLGAQVRRGLEASS